MKKLLNKIYSIYRINKKALLFLFIIGVVGIISGSILSTILSKSDKTLVNNYLITFFNEIKTNKLNYLNILKSGIFYNTFSVLFIWLLGLSVIGIPIIIILYFTKCFVLGFSIASIITSFKIKGILYSFLYIFPHKLLNIVLFVYLIVYAIAASNKIFSSAIKKQTLDFKIIMDKYKIILYTSLVGILAITLYETFIMPNLLKFGLSILKYS